MWNIWLWIKEAASGVMRNFTINFFALALTVISFFILSFWIIISLNVQHTSTVVEEGIKIVVNIEEEVDDYTELNEKILSINGVKEVDFISKDEAFETMKENLGEREDMLVDLGFNPLPASFDVRVEDPENVKLIAKKIESLGISRSIKYGENYVDKIFQTTKGLNKAIFAILIVMVISAGAMIYVSIRMNILNRNKELEIKNLIGAGTFNIRIPFVLEGLMLTISSAAIVLSIIYVFYEKGVQRVLGNYPGSSFVTINEVLNSLIPTLAIIAVATGLFSSILSTAKHLKRH